MNLFKMFARHPTNTAPVKTEYDLWLDSLPIMDTATARLWETVCEYPQMGELIEINTHRVVYVVTDGGELTSENWWVIDSDGKPVAYYRDIEGISEYVEA